MPVVPVERLFKHVRRSYQTVDTQMAKQAKKLKATCTKGCAGCCYQLVSTTFVEALVIADFIARLFEPRQLAAVVEKLKEARERLRFVNNRTTLFLAKQPCPFLIPGKKPYTGECSIYAVRPVTCRMHFVVSDPKLCEPETVYDCDIIDVRSATLSVTEHLSGGNRELASYGPLEPLVLHALELAEEGREGPSPFELDYWRRRIMAMLDHDRAAMKGANLEDKYVR